MGWNACLGASSHAGTHTLQRPNLLEGRIPPGEDLLTHTSGERWWERVGEFWCVGCLESRTRWQNMGLSFSDISGCLWESHLQYGRQHDFVECAKFLLSRGKILNLTTFMALGSVTSHLWSFSFLKSTLEFQYCVSSAYPKVNAVVLTKVFSMVTLLFWGLCWVPQGKKG